MRSCPKCGRVYESDTQKFCTHDGGRLAAQEASSQAETTYDLNQTIRTEGFDPETTVPRMPDPNKTMASLPTSEIRGKETMRGVPPAEIPQEAPPPPPPPVIPQQQPTVTFDESDSMPQYYASAPPQQPPPPQQQQQAPQYQRQQQQNQQAGWPPDQVHQSPPLQAPQYQQQPPSQQQPPIQHAPQHSQSQMPPQYAPGAPSQAPSTAPKAGKSSRLPLIIGLVVILLGGGAAAWYFLIYKKADSSESTNSNSATSNISTNTNGSVTNANAGAGDQPPPPPPNSEHFVNSAANLDGKLAEKYSDFSFYYPNTWERDRKSGAAGSSNFVKVERGLPPDFTQENFAVSWYESEGTFESDSTAVFPKLVESLKTRYASSFPEFEALSEGETTVNGIRGYEFRFKSVSKGTEKGDITVWGRVVFLPPGKSGATNGTQLLMLATSLAPELTGAEDVGSKGELPMILNSFTLGNGR